MKVILPDGTELELADGATGLDAARAIGPKLAEQAVLVRADGEPQDLRLPLPDGSAIQILTTRDRHDPDALYVLRHSAAHLLAEAARRLYPGTKVAIGPPIENGFYYDFEFPEPVAEDELERLEEEIRREIAEGREWEREEISRDDAKARFEAEGEPYKVELVDTADGRISLYRQGDFTDLCRGPHLQNAAPIKAVKLTSLAGAYWRGDETNPQLTRVYGTAFYDPKDLDEHLQRLEEAKRRDHRRLGRELDLFDFSELAPGHAVLAPAGHGVWNVLEDLRRRENRSAATRRSARRSSTTRSSGARRATGRSSGRTCSASRSRSSDFGLKPMNCPGHCLLYSQRPHSYRELPLRLAEAGNLHRNELSGVLHGLLRVRHFVQDDAHIFCTDEQVHDELARLPRLRLLPLRPASASTCASSSRRGPRTGSAPTRSGTAPRRRSRRRSPRAGSTASVSEGEGSFYGPKIDLHMTDSLGRSWQLGTVQLDYQMPKRFGLTYAGERQRGAHAGDDPPRAARLARALPRASTSSTPAASCPCGSRRSRRASSRSPTASRDRGCGRRRRAARARCPRRRRRREETLGKRIRDAELEKVPYVIAGRRQGGRGRHAGRCASAAASGRHVSARTARWTRSGKLLRCEPASRGDRFLTSRAKARRRFNRNREVGGLPACSRLLCLSEEDQQDLVKLL